MVSSNNLYVAVVFLVLLCFFLFCFLKVAWDQAPHLGKRRKKIGERSELRGSLPI